VDAREAGYRRAWARIAGLMYWLVFVFDFSGMTRSGTPVGHWLSLIGGLLTIPLAYGLYAAVAPVQQTVAMTALGFRGAEIVLTLTSVLAGFPAIRSAWAGTPVLELAQWDHSTSFSAFVFTIGSTLFFILFFRSRIIPMALSVLGIFASVAAFGACLAHLIRPAFPAMTIWPWIPMILAELLTGAWLLIRSVRYSHRAALVGAN
jgi:Domain of unknown function (DUF4386)